MNHQSELFDVAKLTGDGLNAGAPEDFTFAQSIAALRAEREYSILECAEISRHPSRTFENWASGHRIPSRVIGDQVLASLAHPDNPPSAKTRKRVEASHHLIWDKQKGWEMRVTVEIGKRVVGKRIRERLKARSLAEAIARRDLIIASYKHLGLVIVDRRQKTQKPRSSK